ncbi:exodeoxyribonuclease VII small subunit [Pectinatus cerevisiiphilus]|uniref:Exodeoxyribonuclease 7 small subunit n=1 Tax=Pectinatus cerevisiiphilus TaxID=86956 RepID=A0A4R3K8F8_9FIRM|nr:exodeoxyribonuclease VII small subunit [Pectinatus cerevisiiphilus]TCS79284.1 exodeoxyribonuclease VII small subunit [Pectinatus cerevisiiphilus]
MPRKKRSFEDAVGELEGLVDELEKGSLPLDDILKKYKESTQLIKFCREELDNADKTVCELLAVNGAGEQVPVDINMNVKETNNE